MPSKWNYLCVMLWVIYMLSIGIHLFTNGFLLTRDTLNTPSQCTPLAFCDDRHNASCLHADLIKETLRADQPEQLADYCLPAKSKVILLVVDALKYDFGVYDAQRLLPLPYENKLPLLHELRTAQPDRTRLLRFIADPPTTTMQRLKALTTGSLPTFVDVGSNFASGEINEDNIIDQLVNNGRRVVFMGDDTWTGLFPGRFARAHPMASFNIYDLDTVDRNIARLLPAELAHNDWDLMIAHTLGVDHCGHKHGPNHPEMARKLRETDALLRDIVAGMDDTTTLVVMGDHGMTNTGDHGGDSDDETNALLFAYSKATAFRSDRTPADNHQPPATMQQIDLVPTLAAILGVPVPYSSLGQINFDLLPASAPHDAHLPAHHEYLVHSLQTARQMRRYQEAMTERTRTLFSDIQSAQHTHEFHSLSGALRALSVDDVPAVQYFLAYRLRPYVRQMRGQFAAVWVNFEPKQMTHGLLFVSLFSVMLFMIINNVPLNCYPHTFSSQRCAFVGGTNAVLALLGWAFHEDFDMAGAQRAIMVLTGIGNLVLIGLAVVLDFDTIVGTFRVRRQNEPHAASVWLVRVIFTFSLAVCFSNSFVVHEQYVLSYSLMAVLAVLLYAVQKTHMQFDGRRRVTWSAVWRSTYVRMLALTVATVALVRMSHGMFRCREEQGGQCVDGTTVAADAAGKSRRVQCGDLLPVLVLALFLGGANRLLGRFGTLRGLRPAVCMARFGAGLLGAMVAVHFVLSRVVSNGLMAGVGAAHVDAVAWIAYSVSGLHVIVLVCSPLLVHVVLPVDAATGATRVQAVFRELRDGWSKVFAPKPYDMLVQIPQTLGLHSAYTAVFVQCATVGGALVALVLGAPAASGISVTLTVATAVLVLGAVQRFQTAKSIGKCLQPDFTILLAWTLLAHYSFYATSHQPTLSQIHWQAAFVGRQTQGDEHNNIAAVLLVLLNTFGAPALVFMLYPLLGVFGFTLYAHYPQLVPRANVVKVGRYLVNVRSNGTANGGNNNDGGKAHANDGPDNHLIGRQHTFELARGELNVFEEEDTLMANVFRTGVQLIVLQGFRIFASMLACTIHCRHLMVWKIFAPRFMYEGLISYAMFGAIVLGFALVVRIHAAIDGLLRCIALDKSVFDRNEKKDKDDECREAGKLPETVPVVGDLNRKLMERMEHHLASKSKQHGD